jgi:tetratricopeptide (TPR) repeat protein
MFRDPPKFLLALLLVAGSCLVYGRVAGFGFVLFDDHQYLTSNPVVRNGLTWEGLRWAFTTTHLSNWHPLTWLSHMLDVELFGMNPGAHHLVNLLFHVLNGLFLFFFLIRTTGESWKSWIVAALFLLHPLHVESVAWIAERKDVLSTFFMAATLWAYARYAARPSAASFIPVVPLFALGLLSKPTLVTLPFALLLLDYWPLRRIGTPVPREESGPPPPSFAALVREKWPLFALTLVSCVATYQAQSGGQSVATSEIVPASVRVSNAIVSYVAYLRQMLFPAGLAVFYPLRAADLTLPVVAGALSILAVVTGAVLAMARRAPYLLTGWFWYLGTLVPMIGIVQVGEQAMADRYTYIPLIGIFLMIAWGLPALPVRWPPFRRILGAAAAIWLVVLSVAAWRQTGYWRDSITLDTRALDVAPDSDKMRKSLGLAHNELGMALLEKGRYGEASAHFADALTYSPFEVVPLMNLGAALAMDGRLDEALPRFEKVLEIQPGNGAAHGNLGRILLQKGRRSEAIAHLQAAVQADPSDAQAIRMLEEALRPLPASGR